ncbi:MAG: hypothetical protein J5482_01100 [Oscillospiraceae bacterium]|nr:hypothetical protein [Oscillospiraceae bacterium]
MRYLLGVDVGTSALKAVLFDENGATVCSVTKEYTLHVSGDVVEYPAEGYWRLFKEALDEIRADYPVYALSIDTQCETMIVTDASGKPLCNAIVWLDNRAAAQAEELRARFGEKAVYEHTGQPEITATWPASKLLWLRQNRGEVWQKLDKVFLLEDYLLYRLTGRFVTERTLQSSSLYYDIRTGQWWDEMLDYLQLSPDHLPELLDSGVAVGTYEGITVVTGAMDQVAGAIGSGIVRQGGISEMTGTTMTVFVPVPEIPPYRAESKIPCHVNYDGRYCLPMWSPTAGIALKWFKAQLCEGLDYDALNKLAAAVPPGCDDLTFLPYLSGSVMPRYNPAARGAFLGLTMAHTRGHMVRGIFESVAFMLREHLEYLGAEITEIRSTGGGANSPLWCQIKADVCGKTIVTLKNKETACLGSAILAGVGTGIFSSIEAASDRFTAVDRVYTPSGTDYTPFYQRFIAMEDQLTGK